MTDTFVEAGYARDIARYSLTKTQRIACIEALYFENAPALTTFQRTTLRNSLAAAMQPLVRRCAKQLLRQGRVLDADFADLIQSGNIGLLQGIATWRPDGGAKLASWCAWSIKREMTRENDRAPVVPHAHFANVESYQDTDQWSDAQEEGDRQFSPGNEYAATDAFDPEPAANTVEGTQALTDVWNEALSAPEAWVLEYLYWRDMSTRETAEKMKISHTQVARLHASALEKFRGAFTLRGFAGN